MTITAIELAIEKCDGDSRTFLNRLHLLTGAKIRRFEVQIRPQQSVGF